jgi:hypothetical protein
MTLDVTKVCLSKAAKCWLFKNVNYPPVLWGKFESFLPVSKICCSS